MADGRTVVYEAETAPEAERLRERLEEAGITAVVDRETAERETSRQWALPARVPVLVDEMKVHDAKRIVEQFDGQSHNHALKVVYEARSVPEAQRLKERLEEAGITAVVSTELVEGEASSDVWGLPVPARVAVADDRAEASRRIALDFDAEIIDRAQRDAEKESRAGKVFDRDLTASQVETAPEDVGSTVLAGPAVWPHCPECSALRVTRCPACGVTGTEFRRAELPEATEEQAKMQSLVICSECDEPFEPVYARRCHQCGHEFADGYSDAAASPLSERLSNRILLAILAIVAVIGGMLLYFAAIAG